MQRVALISDVKKVSLVNQGFSRIYFGNEFCDYLIPGIPEMKRLDAFCARHKVGCSVVTPCLNERNLNRLNKVLIYLAARREDTEVIVNDWGVVELIKKEFPKLNIVLGRLLTRQKGGFFMIDSKDMPHLMKDIKLRKADREYLKYSILQNKFILDFIKGLGITRLGLNNIKQGLDLRGARGFKIDLYYPYVFITTSNYCLTSALENNGGVLEVRSACNRICMKVGARSVDICGEKMYLVGNSQFCYNPSFEKVDLSKIDRLVEVII